MSSKPSLKPVSNRAINSLQLILKICEVAGEKSLTKNTIHTCNRSGLTDAVRSRDTSALFNTLMGYFSMQGVSDYVAFSYIEEHGNAEYEQMSNLMAHAHSQDCCPKLQSFDRFAGCAFSKSAKTCSEPEHMSTCSLPTLPLRKGQLNQAAFSLYLFIADICSGDLVGYIDKTLKAADRPGHPDRLEMMRRALVEELMSIFGISKKLIHMTFADVLIGCGEARPRWQEVGQSMIAVDTLVHNFLHRSGILYAYGAEHMFGQACYGPNGCEMIIDDLARQIDARSFNRRNPVYYPRFVQKAIWWYCAESGFNICNGRNIADKHRCQLSDCALYDTCGRIPLHTA